MVHSKPLVSFHRAGLDFSMKGEDVPSLNAYSCHPTPSHCMSHSVTAVVRLLLVSLIIGLAHRVLTSQEFFPASIPLISCSSSSSISHKATNTSSHLPSSWLMFRATSMAITTVRDKFTQETWAMEEGISAASAFTSYHAKDNTVSSAPTEL